MRRVARTLGRMRLQGDDPIRLLFVEPSQIQTNLKRSEIDPFQRDRVRRDEDLEVVDGDAAELVLRGDQLRVEFAGAAAAARVAALPRTSRSARSSASK